MSLTVRELVEIPHLGTRVHAGRAGLDREIEFACACEMAAPWEWLSDGDLLLTSGIGLPERAADQAEYIRRLDDAGICGVSIGEPIDLPPIWPEMERAADRHHLPVLITAYEVPFIAVSRAVVDANAREGEERLHKIARLYDRVRTAAAAGHPAKALLDSLGDELDSRLAVYENSRGRRLLADNAAAPESNGAGALRNALMTAVREHDGRMPAVVHLLPSEAPALAVPVPSTRPASLVVTPKARATLPDIALLQHVAAVIGLELERTDRQRGERLRLGGEVLAEMLDAPMEASVARYRLAAYGIEAGQLVLAAWGPAELLDVEVLHDALVDSGIPHLALPRDDATITLVDAAVDLGGVASLLPPAARVGLSTAFARPVQTADALRQAVWALNAAADGASWLVRYGEQHAPFLPRTLAEADSVVESVLGPLLDYDRGHRTELVHTLRVFLQCNRSWKRAAELLFVHKQTLVYRTRRIEEVTGCRLDDTQQVAEFWFALRALELAGGRTSENRDPDSVPVLP